MTDTVDAAAIAGAAARLASVVTTTPLHESPRLGAALGRAAGSAGPPMRRLGGRVQAYVRGCCKAAVV